LYRGRFAPSPTGQLHLGSLTTALGSWLMARHEGGEWLVRIEDLDPPREIAGMAEQQLATLAAFGMVSDSPVVRQSERAELYGQALRRLCDRSEAYACLCSRSDLAACNGIHQQCVERPSGLQAAWRLRVPDRELAFVDGIRGPYSQSLRRESGDFVLRRADGLWAYQLAVVVDDAEQGITDVVRGADLIDSTPRQILLQERLGLATPSYAHLPTVLGPDGSKLAKSLASLPVDAGNPLPCLRMAWRLLGQAHHALDSIETIACALAAAQSAFDPGRIPTIDLAVAM
jgi:glutamyl-Q tRNA(Asp) synthetase